MDGGSGSSYSHFIRRSFDVFLSFRGEDTRFNFTSHLNMALRQRGINVFIDNKLPRGAEISTSILKAIEESRISIVIISENYASSSWCLNELEKIIECSKFNAQIVLPIFYKVNPSDVKKQSGAFGEAFAKHKVRSFNKMQAWREALTIVPHMSGWVLEKDDEANLIQNIVQQVLNKLNRGTTELHIAKYPVGIDIQVMNLLPYVVSDETTMIGIHGIGGMGKTTLVKALYNKIAINFEGYCFLSNIREASKQYGGLVQLQEKLLSVIHYCKGLPLAIEVLGSFLYSTDPSKFKNILDEYESSCLDKDIQNILQISYDGLEDDVKEIFLFISCCFRGEHVDDVKRMLEACGNLCSEKGIRKLMNLSLLTIDELNNIQMHELIQQMGHTIALSETSKPHKRKRLLLSQDDVLEVLNGNKEARAVKVIKLGFHQPTELDIDARAFEKVKTLVALEVQNATTSKNLDYLPDSLRLIRWSEFPFSSLPPSFTMKNLIQLKLPYSSIKHFGNGFTNCEWLKRVDLRMCKFIEEIPDLSAAVNLEELDLLGCTNLVKVHESVGSLVKLVELNLSQNHNLEQLPSYLKLISIESLSLEDSSKLEHLPHWGEEMSRLKELSFWGYTKIKELPPSIGNLTNLMELNLYDCTNFTTLPSTVYRLSNLSVLNVQNSSLSTFPSLFSPSPPLLFPNLTILSLTSCKIKNLSFLDSLSHVVPSLRELDLSGNYLSIIPSSIVNFASLKILNLYDCKLLQEIQKVPQCIRVLNTQGCISLARFPDNLVDIISSSCDSEYVDDGRFRHLILMNCDIPKWYSYKNIGNSITFSMPLNMRRKIKAFAPCVIIQMIHDYEPQLKYWHGIYLHCKVAINDVQIWSSKQKRKYCGIGTPMEHFEQTSCDHYMWLIALNPYRDFDFYPEWMNGYDKWEEYMETSEMDLDPLQPCSSINSMEIDSNNVNDLKFFTSFEIDVSLYKHVVKVISCGVHVVIEE